MNELVRCHQANRSPEGVHACCCHRTWNDSSSPKSSARVVAFDTALSHYFIMIIGYLSQGGPFHPKHGGGRFPSLSNVNNGVNNNFNYMAILPPLHPFLAFIVHYSIAISTIYAVHDAFFFDMHSRDETSNTPTQRQVRISQFLFIYTAILFIARYISSYHAGRLRHHSVLYELTWLCNSTLVMSCISYGAWGIDHWIFRRRPLIATSCSVAVSIDQILWYVDLIVWSVTGKFPFGVTKYLAWKQTLWIDRFTCTHHLWTIPLLFYGENGPITWKSFQLSVYIVTCHVMLSRWLTPHVIQCGTTMTATKTSNGSNGKSENGIVKDTDPNHYRYLNVNLSHELWRDIKLPFLQISKDNPTAFIYFIRLLMRWHLFNALAFAAILLPLSWVL